MLAAASLPASDISCSRNGARFSAKKLGAVESLVGLEQVAGLIVDELVTTQDEFGEDHVAVWIEDLAAAELAPPSPEAPADTQPKRRGRPAGAKDKQPRKQKPGVVEVDITPPQASQASAQASAQPSEPEPAQPSDPMTPRRMYRETATHLAHLKTLINSQKRQALGEMYTRKLITLVQ